MINAIKDGVINAVIRQGTLLKQFTDYVARVLADSGLIKDRSVTNRYIQMAKSNGMLDSIKFAWLGESGGKFRDSGTNRFWTKIYSLVTTNDATQTTANFQPYISGNIAPNEKLCLKNNNGDFRYMTHPTISFAANEAWTVATVVNWNGGVLTNAAYYRSVAEATSNTVRFYSGSFQFLVRNNNGLDLTNSGSQSLKVLGKNSILHFVAKGNSTINVYLNGIYLQTLSGNTTEILFSSICSNVQPLYGEVKADIIHAQALTPTQVAAEANFLRTLYPEIPSVTIGSQVWATSNCEMVATPRGNLIASVTENANVEKITNAADRGFSSDTGFWTKGGDATINGGTANLIYNTSAGELIRLNSLIVGKWYKFTYDILSNNGGSLNFASVEGNINSTIGNSKVIYFYAVTTYINLKNVTASTTIIVDNVSVQEVGWSGSTELYDAIYAQTAGTDEQKTYAGVKAAAMWCYYNNDVALGSTYGKLYNWYAVKLLQMDIDYYNAANPATPWGWRVPIDTDFNTLATALGGASVAGGKMKALFADFNNVYANNSSGLSIINSGFRRSNGVFGKDYTRIWSTIERDITNSYIIQCDPTSTTILLFYANKSIGYTFRLIKN